MKSYILGIDLGTSGVKAGLLDVETLKVEYVSTRSYDDSAEQDPNVLWQCTLEAVKESVVQLGGQKIVKAIGLTGQMHGAVLYDAGDNLLGPITNWKDEKRSGRAIIEKIKHIMGDKPYDGLGTDISSGYSAAILFGIKEVDPHLFHQIAHFLLPTDFLRGKLMGRNDYATDPTNAFGTGVFNVKQNHWNTELINDLQIPLNIFPAIHNTSEKAGVISDDIAHRVGLEEGIPIIYGGGDNQMSMLGSGLASANSPLLINVGTAAQISRVVSIFITHPGLDTRSYFNGDFALVGASLAGGGCYKWLRDQIREKEGVDIDYDEMNELAANTPPGAEGLLFYSGSSKQDRNRKSRFFGNLALCASIGHQARAVMEGVLMDLYDAFEILEEDDRIKFMVGAGKGLQESRIWTQIAADLFGKPLRITQFENAVYGASIMAAFSVGAISTLREAVPFIEHLHGIIPDQTNTRFFRDEFVPTWRAKMLV